jgi:hypothetical protein
MPYYPDLLKLLQKTPLQGVFYENIINIAKNQELKNKKSSPKIAGL